MTATLPPVINLDALIAAGEDSRHQFKRDIAHVDKLAAELVAFALLSNAASQHVKPPINPLTTNVDTGQGRIWVKSGADKRQVTAREEMQRMFQAAGLIHADELPAGHSRIDDLDQAEFSRYFERRYGKPVSSVGIPLEQLLQNLNLARQGAPNLTGMLLFGKSPSNQLPAFVVKAVAFPGTVLHDTQCLDSEDIDGTLPQQYQRCIAFIKRNLHHVQSKRNPALASHAFHMLPYRGLGSGIPRAVAAWPKLEFIDDRQGNQFKVVVKRGAQQPDGTNVGVNVGANHLLVYIQTHPGQRASEMAAAYKLTQRTLERWLKQLKDQGKIEFKGATKTGGYYSKTSGDT